MVTLRIDMFQDLQRVLRFLLYFIQMIVVHAILDKALRIYILVVLRVALSPHFVRYIEFQNNIGRRLKIVERNQHVVMAFI